MGAGGSRAWNMTNDYGHCVVTMKKVAEAPGGVGPQPQGGR